MSSIPTDIYLRSKFPDSFWEEGGSVQYEGNRYTFSELAKDNPQKLRKIALKIIDLSIQQWNLGPTQQWYLHVEDHPNFLFERFNLEKQCLKDLENLKNRIRQLTKVLISKNTDNRESLSNVLSRENENAFVKFLKHALKERSHTLCSYCLDQIMPDVSGVKLYWDHFEKTPLDITVSGDDIEQVHTYLRPFIKLLEEDGTDFKFHLIPPKSVSMSKLINFVHTYGKRVYKLNFAEMGNQLKSCDAKVLIGKCSNIQYLKICSDQIKDEELSDIDSALKQYNEMFDVQHLYDRLIHNKTGLATEEIFNQIDTMSTNLINLNAFHKEDNKVVELDHIKQYGLDRLRNDDLIDIYPSGEEYLISLTKRESVG